MNHPIGIRRRPTLPGRVQPRTIGAEGLNFCVRYGNRWGPFAIATGNCSVLWGLRSAFAHRTCPRYPFILWRLPLLPAFALPSQAPHPFRLRFRASSSTRAALSHRFRGLPAPAFRTLTTAHCSRICLAWDLRLSFLKLSPRPISIIKLHLLPNFHR